jgi:hypothetical protein
MAPPSGFSTIRDFVTFVIGAVIVIYTVIVREPPADVVAVGVGVTLCGLPLVAMLPGGGTKDEPPPAKRDP